MTKTTADRARRGVPQRATAAIAAALALLALPTAASAAPSNIDPSAGRSLTVTKYSAPTTGGYTGNHGEAVTGVPTGSTPLAGVEFTIQRVTQLAGAPVDLTTTEGWDAIADYLDGTATFDPGSTGTTLAAGSAKTTNSSGVAQWVTAELPIGLYWVTETDSGSHAIAQPAKPFLVTVPAPVDGTPGAWNYHVHAYPKNTIVTASKAVDTSGAQAVGDYLTWSVTGSIPANPSTGVILDRYEVVDTLPAGVTYDAAPAQAAVSHQAIGAAQGTALTSPGDFTVTSAGSTVTMTLTSVGRGKVQTAVGLAGGDVTFTFRTRVTGLGANGSLINQADVRINDAVVPVEAPAVGFGPLRIDKIAEGDATKPLDGAEFQVFATLAEAQAANLAVRNGQATVGAIDVLVGSTMTTTFTTGTSPAGRATIPGLLAAAGGTDYYVVEVEAPAGYLRHDGVLTATVKPEAAATTDAILQVSNAKYQALQLAATGSTTQTVAVAAGVTLLVAGVVATALPAARRRRAK